MSIHETNGRLNESTRRKLLQGVESRRPAGRDLPLADRLRAIAEELPPTSIDELWVFPPLPSRDTGSEFILLTSFDGPTRRRVITAHMEAAFEDEDGTEFVWVQRVHELGVVPQDWLESLPDGLLRRLAEAGVPHVVEVGGRLEVWAEALDHYANGVEDGNGAGIRPHLTNGTGHVDSPAKS